MFLVNINVDNVNDSDMLATVAFIEMNPKTRFISLIHGFVLAPAVPLFSLSLCLSTI